MKQNPLRSLFVLAVLLAAALAAAAQQATLRGTVTDPQNAVVGNAPVQVINQDSKAKATVRTDHDGVYTAALAPGRYQVVVQAPGFAPAKSGELSLAAGETLTYDVRLAVGAVEANVTVKGTAESIPNPNPQTSIGPVSDKTLLDLPYSVFVVPHELIENVQSAAPDQILKMSPVTQLYMPTSLNLRPTFNLRGFYVAASAEDGMRNYNGWVNALEDVERIEITTGLSSFLYGPGNVGGLVNYITKDPTPTRLTEITVGDYGGMTKYVHGDFGGPIDSKGKFGYRLNIAAQDGDTAIDKQSLTRFLSSGTLDWHATSKLLIQLKGSYQDFSLRGAPTSWTAASGVQYPQAPDAGKLWSQPWTYDNLRLQKVGTRVKYDISKIFTLRAAFDFAEYHQKSNTLSGTIKSATSYTESFQVRAPRTLSDPRGYVFLDAKFKTSFLKHKLTFGYAADAYKWRQHKDATYNSATLTGFGFQTPLYIAQPSYSVGVQPMYTSNMGLNGSVILGDEITIDRHWSVLAGLSYVSIIANNFSTTGAKSSFYDVSRPTPSASLMYKVTPKVSTYFTYMQSLEQGVTVGSGYTNTGAIMAPLRSFEYEGGVKATVHGALLTAAVFQINKANFYSSPGTPLPTYTQDGREVHNGLEFTVTGKPFWDITMVGGLTLMDTNVEKATNTALIGKRPTNVSKQMAKLYAERSVPGLRPLFMTAGIYWTSQFYADALNTVELPSAKIGDVGLRYNLSYFSEQHPLILRLTVANVANKSYWTSSSFEGDPRSIAFSAQMKF
jgi:iron complex outermembrane receptor protein